MKIVCNVCGKMGYLQHLSKNYYRVRHYGGLNPITQKPRFEYHKQNPSYIDKVFKEQANNNEALSIDLIGQGNINLNLNNSGFNLKNALRGCPSLVGGRPAKPVVSNGRVGSNPTPRAKMVFCALN